MHHKRGRSSCCGSGRAHQRTLAPAWLACALSIAAIGAASAQTATPAPPPVPAPAASAAALALRVPVTRYDVQGNTLLPPGVIGQALEGYTGEVPLERLRAAAAAVQDLYRDAGYGGVVAFLPEQDLRDGVVMIRVIEGKLVRVDITGNKQYSSANIRASLPSLLTGVTPQVRRIDAEIQIANENPGKNVQALLQPGGQPGEVVAALTVTEQPEQRITARLDNTGGKQIGRLRAALGWQHANLWDKDHVFAAELQTAPEDTAAVKVLSGSYRAPLYGQAMAWDGYFAWSDVDAGKVDTAAGDLSFTGKGTIVGTRISMYLPRQGNIDQRAIIGLESREYKNNCSIAGLPQGACGAAGSSVSVQPVSLIYTAQATQQLRWGLSLGVYANAAMGGSNGAQEDFDAVRSGAKRRYALLRGAGQVTAPLGDTLSVTWRLNLQLSGQPLVPGEMFGAGGAQSVRGYEEREVSGDSGAAVSLELQGGNLAEGWSFAKGLVLQALVFVDAGTVANRAEAPCLPGQTRCPISSAGVGLRGEWAGATLRLDVAGALHDASTTRRGGGRAHATLLYTF